MLPADYDWPKRGDPILRAIGDHFILPVDLIVCTPEQFAKQRTNPYSVIHTSLETGELLYERRAA